ncbi:MAG: hypothetical protein KF914_14125 [Rhizobiaceae bacterium]|nr:hypothetical protein [Rhizobiaceae bacterium]
MNRQAASSRRQTASHETGTTMNLLESSVTLSGRPIGRLAPAPVRILSFAETPNQLHMARETARMMARDIQLEVFVIQKIFRLPPHLLLEAAEDMPVHPVDRSGVHNAHDGEILFCAREWFKSVIDDYAAVLMFNDGTRVSLMVSEWARQSGKPVAVVQDGVLGHVTNPGLRSYPAFLALHAKLLASQFMFLDAAANVANVQWAAQNGVPGGLTLQKLYDLHCGSTKIGAGKASQYFVHNQDIRIKTAIRHALPAQSIAVTGSFHAVPPRGRNEAERPAADILYVGQCHTRHGKARLEDWLSDFRQIVDSMAGQDVLYRFHPGELPSTRKMLTEIIDGRFRIDTSGILRASDLGRYGMIVSETSSVTFDAIRAGKPAIVVEAPCLAERLPRVDHPLLIYTTPPLLANAIRATLAGHRPPAALPVELQGAAFLPAVTGFEEPLRRWIRKVSPPQQAERPHTGGADRNEGLTHGILALPLDEILADARAIHACDTPQWDTHYCAALLGKLGLPHLPLWYQAMWGQDWAHRLLRQIVVNRVADEARLQFLVARTFAQLDPLSFRALVDATKPAAFRDLLLSVRAIATATAPVRLPDLDKHFASSPIWGALYARALRRGLLPEPEDRLAQLIENRHLEEFGRASAAVAARSRRPFGSYLAAFLVERQVEERHVIHRVLSTRAPARLAAELPDFISTLLSRNAPDAGRDTVKLVAKLAEYADRQQDEALADMLIGIALAQKPRSKRLLRTRILLAVRRNDVSGFQDAIESFKHVSPTGVAGLVSYLRELHPGETEALLASFPELAD